MPAMLDLTGKKFNNLTAIKQSGYSSSNKIKWLCKCDCGNMIEVIGTRIFKGKTLSCGCAKKDHGDYKTRFYKIWESFNNRCRNINQKNYGGRGIKVSEDWKDYKNFKRDMYNKYIKHVQKYGEKNTSIERKNNNDGYSKENCTWATRLQQSRNQRRLILFYFKGKKRTLAEISQMTNVSYELLRSRIKRNKGKRKWTINEAIREHSARASG